MRNQVREKEDGTFEVGAWMFNAKKEPFFFDIAIADNLKQALEMVDYYNEQDFKLAKFEIEKIGGIDTANRILMHMKATNTEAILFEKGHFNLNNIRYIDQNAVINFMESFAYQSGTNKDECVQKWDIEKNLKTIRFLWL